MSKSKLKALPKVSYNAQVISLSVLSGSHPDPHYRRTRLFYERMGFRPLQEFEELWGPENPCLQMIKKL